MLRCRLAVRELQAKRYRGQELVPHDEAAIELIAEHYGISLAEARELAESESSRDEIAELLAWNQDRERARPRIAPGKRTRTMALAEQLAEPRVSARARHLRGFAPGKRTRTMSRDRLAASLAGASRNPRKPQPRAIEPEFRTRMEQLFSADFTDVSVLQQSARARGLTRALTTGGQIHFRADAYRPGTAEGDKVIAHELAHIAQQRSVGIAEGSRAEIEADADRMAQLAMVGASAQPRYGASAAGAYAFDDGGDHDAAGSEGERPVGEQFKREQMVEVDGLGPAVVLASVEGGMISVQLFGTGKSRKVAAEKVAAGSFTLENRSKSTAAGGIAHAYFGGSWGLGLVLSRDTQSVDTAGLGSVSRQRATVAPIEDDKVRLDQRASICSAILPPESSFNVGDEVYAQRDQDTWVRGLVRELKRPDAKLAMIIGEAKADGFIYVIELESDVKTWTEDYELDQLHDAEPLADASPTLPETAPELSEDAAEGPVAEAHIAEAGADSAVAAGELAGDPSAGGVEGEGPAGVELAGSCSEEPSSPVVEVPVPPSSGGREPGDVLSPNFSLGDAEICGDLEDEVSAVLQGSADRVQEAVQASRSAAGTSGAQMSSAAAGLEAAVDTQSAAARGVCEAASTEVRDAAAQGVAAVTATTTAAESEIDQTTTTAEAALQTTEDTTRATVEANIDRYANDFDAAIQVEYDALEIRLKQKVAALAAEAKGLEDDAAKTARGHSDVAGALSAAQGVAKQLAEASTKKKNVAALTKVINSALERLAALKGEPMKVLSGQLAAPTLNGLWPAREAHQKKILANKKAARDRTQNLRETLAGVVTKKSEAVAEQADASIDNAQTAVGTAKGVVTASVERTAAANRDEVLGVAADAEEHHNKTVEAVELAAAENPEVISQDGAVEAAITEVDSELQEATTSATQAVEQGARQTTAATERAAAKKQAELDAGLVKVQQYVLEDRAEFVTEVAAGVEQTSTDLGQAAAETQTLATTEASAHQEGATAAVADLETEAQEFIKGTVKEVSTGFVSGVDATVAELDALMVTDLATAVGAAATAEHAHLRGRANKAYDAAEATWGTDEGMYMSALSGVSPVQGYALQGVYATLKLEGLRTRIASETSFSLEESLLAWTIGRDDIAVAAAMRHALPILGWGADRAISETALKGLSDDGRKALKGNQEFSDNTQALQNAVAQDQLSPFEAKHRAAALGALADMSKSKADAETLHDAITLYADFEGLGTNRKEVFATLAKRDGAGNQKVAEAFAKYSADQSIVGKSWDEMSPQEQAHAKKNSLKVAIDDDMDGNDELRGRALLAGNKGLARAAAAEQSAAGINDVDAALAATSFSEEKNGQTWMDRVGATQERAEMLQGIADIESGAWIGQDRIDAHDDVDHQRQVLDAENVNLAAAESFVNREFGSLVDTREDLDVVREQALMESLHGGQPDVDTLMALGMEGVGTDEAKVTLALTRIAGEADIHLRLLELEKLGSYCKSLLARQPENNQLWHARHQAKGQISKLPSYVDGELRAKHPTLVGKIEFIITALYFESSGSELFNFEMLLVKATVRDQNVHDQYKYAVQRFLSADLTKAELETYRNDPKVKEALNGTDVLARVEAENKSPDGDGYQEFETTLDHEQVLAVHLLRLERSYDNAAGELYDDDGWLDTDAQGKTTAEAEAWFKTFKRQCDNVDDSAQDKVRGDQVAGEIAATVVATVAGVVITGFTMGGASGATVALLTLTAGVATVTVKVIALGNLYGAEDLAIDLGKAVANAVLAIATMGVGTKPGGLGAVIDEWAKAGGKSLVRPILAEAAKEAPGAVVELIQQEDLWRGEKLEKHVGKALVKILAAGVSGGATDQVKIGGKLTDAENLLKKATGDAIGNALKLLANPYEWDSSLGLKLLKAGAEQLLAAGVRNKILDRTASKFNLQDSLSDADWDGIAAMGSHLQGSLLAKLSASHRADLSARAAINPVLKPLADQLDAPVAKPASDDAAPVAKRASDDAEPVAKPSSDDAEPEAEPVSKPASDEAEPVPKQDEPTKLFEDAPTARSPRNDSDTKPSQPATELPARPSILGPRELDEQIAFMSGQAKIDAIDAAIAKDIELIDWLNKAEVVDVLSPEESDGIFMETSGRLVRREVLRNQALEESAD